MGQLPHLVGVLAVATTGTDTMPLSRIRTGRRGAVRATYAVVAAISSRGAMAFHESQRRSWRAGSCLCFPSPMNCWPRSLENSHLHVPERAARPHVWRDVASPLATVLPGLRYHALFAHLRKWSYPQAKGNSLADWKRRVEDQAFSLNSQFPFPFKRAELRQVRDTAASVSSWTWDRLRRYSHTPEAQAARARRQNGNKAGTYRRARRRDPGGRAGWP